jgi:hypothetical protein
VGNKDTTRDQRPDTRHGERERERERRESWVNGITITLFVYLKSFEWDPINQTELRQSQQLPATKTGHKTKYTSLSHTPLSLSLSLSHFCFPSLSLSLSLTSVFLLSLSLSLSLTTLFLLSLSLLSSLCPDSRERDRERQREETGTDFRLENWTTADSASPERVLR